QPTTPSSSHTTPLTPLPSCLLPPSPPTALYPLSLHDALPIFGNALAGGRRTAFGLRLGRGKCIVVRLRLGARERSLVSRGRYRPDRKSTRLNSSHRTISYAVFCLKKKK